MPDLHKTLIVSNVRRIDDESYVVDELAIATEHAPFRHKIVKGVGEQVKQTGGGSNGKHANGVNDVGEQIEQEGGINGKHSNG